MASTYTTGFGIEKIGSGEQDGTWGTTTNHNFDILDRIASYKAVAITTNADTATLTVREASPGSGTENLQDGMYRVIKFTGTLDSTCTITIAPNTAPAWFIIENATSGSQSIILSQGSGANVTVQNGKNAIIYCDGAGSGAAVVDALADLQVGTLEVTGAAAIDGALTGSSTIQGTTITATTAFVPDASDGAALGTTSLEFSDLYLADGAVIGFGDDQDVTLTHVADTGLLLSSTDQLQFGDSGTYIHQSADGVLDLVSDTEIEINATTVDINGAVDVSGTLAAGITTLSTSTTSHLLNLVSTEAGAGTGPVLEFYRNSSSPADNDSLGWLEFYGEEETSSDKVRYAQFGAKIFDSADGSFDGSFLWQMALAGSLTEFMKLSPTGFTFNEAGNAELDFRVESQYSNQALFLDAGAGTFAANVTSATFSGTISVPTDKKIFLDGGGDTYIIESAANVVSHFAGTRENLKVGYTGVSVNEGGNDIDFRVESSGNANMLFVDGGNNKVSIGTNTSDGTLHVYTASAGSVAASADADELVLENSGNAGLSILAAASSNAQIYFGEGTDNDAAFIQYNGSIDDLILSTTNAGSKLILKADAGVTQVTFDGAAGSQFAEFANDIGLKSDSSKIYFGADNDVHITHTADVGLTLNKELAVGGGSNLNASNHFTLDIAGATRYVRTTLDNNSTGGRQFSIHSVGDGDSTVPNSFAVYDDTASAWRQRIDSSGNVDFYADMRLAHDGAVLGFGADYDVTLTHVHDTGLKLSSGDVLHLPDNTKLRLGDLGDCDIYHDNTNTLIQNGTGDFIIDAASDIILDADGGDVIFKDGGTAIGTFANNSNNLRIVSNVSDADIILRGVDGGSAIDAVTVDMSDAGTAIFNHDVNATSAGSKFIFGHSSYLNTGTSDYPQIHYSNKGNTLLLAEWSATNTSEPTLRFLKSASSTIGTNTLVADDENLGAISFNAADGTDLFSIAATIKAYVDGTPGASDMPGRLEFATSADGADSPTTRMTIDSAGTTTFAGSAIGNTFAAKTNPGVGNDQIYLGFSAPNGLIYSKNSSGAPASNISLGTTAADGTTSNVLTLSYDKSAEFTGDVKLKHDGAVLYFGTDSEINLEHVADHGLKTNGHLNILDDKRIYVGTHNDLQIYHDGDHSQIADTGTGNLYLSGSVVTIANVGGSQNIAHFNDGGGCHLYFANDKKLETVDKGVQFPEAIIIASEGNNVNGLYKQYVRALGDDPSNVDLVDITLPNYATASVKVRVTGRGSSALATQHHSEQTYAMSTDTSSVNVHSGTQVDIDTAFTLAVTTSGKNVTIDATASNCGGTQAYVEILTNAAFTDNLS